MDMSGLLTKMLVFVVLMVIGYVCARTKFASREFIKDASKMVVNVFMTATILKSVLSAGLDISGGELAMAVLVMSLTMLICYVVGFLCRWVVPLHGDEKPLFELLISVMNSMFIGLPVLSSFYGDKAVFYCSISCIAYNALLYTYGVYRLKSGGSGGIRLREMFSVPLLATLLALLIFILRPPVPAVVRELADTMSGVTMPLSMIVIGASLGNVSLLDSFKDWRLYISSALRLLLCPLVVWFIVRYLTADPVLLASAVVVAGCPSAIMVTVLAIQNDRDAVYSSKGILLSTVLSMATIPLLMLLLN